MKFKNLLFLSSALFFNSAYSQTDLVFKAGFEYVHILNDTGVTWGGDHDTGANVGCVSNISAPQDCHHGRDATENDDSDGHAGFSFTKLDASGLPLDASAISWSCVLDNVTGLVWEVKTDDDGIHDWDNTYRWGGVSHLGTFGTEFFDDWDTLVNGTNTETLCGFIDWRVPTNQELMSIVNNSRINPAIDLDYFPNTKDSFDSLYWTASPKAVTNNAAWMVNFKIGETGDIGRSFSTYIRLVRSEQ